MKRGTPDHPKMRALCRRLGVARWQALGIVEGILHFTAQYARRGDIGRWSDDEIAEWLEWKGDPGDLITALTNVGWLDPCPLHRLVVHDWHEHADQTCRRSQLIKQQGFVCEGCSMPQDCPLADASKARASARKSPANASKCSSTETETETEAYTETNTETESMCAHASKRTQSPAAIGHVISASGFSPSDSSASASERRDLVGLQQQAVAAIAKHLGLSMFARDRPQGAANLTTVCNLVQAIWARDGPKAAHSAVQRFGAIAAEKAAAKGLKSPMGAFVKAVQKEFDLPRRFRAKAAAT